MKTQKVLTLDVETTIKGEGHAFDADNKLCLVGLSDESRLSIYDIEYSGNPYNELLKEIKKRIEEADLLVGFNIKFDLHWIKRYINDISFPPVWDCQLGEFILSNQTNQYPSLDSTAIKYGLGGKYNVVVDEYWSNGIDTPQVPIELLRDYLKHDLDLTHAVFKEQEKTLRSSALFRLHCSDLKVLQEMEFNGMLFKEALSLEKADIYDNEIKLLDGKLKLLCPIFGVNFNSPTHLSALLYGGTIRIPARIATCRTLKDGNEKIGSKNGFEEISFPRLIVPLLGTETLPTSKLKGEELNYENNKRLSAGLHQLFRRYSIDKGTLKVLKARGTAKKIIEILLRRSKMEKLQSTYLRGIPKIMQERGWKDGIIHGQLNQCVARTGRLSSSKPNLQNQAEEIKELFGSRYA